MTDPRADDLGTQPTIPVLATGEPGARPADPAPLPRPRIRFGAIAWGLIVCALAATVFWISTDDGRRDAFGTWVTGLTPGTFGLLVMLVLGALLLLWGGLAAIRRSQERAPRL
jgi:hypothetical protein